MRLLGAYSKLSPIFIGQVEGGAHDASLSTVHKLARGLGIPPDTFFGSGSLSTAAFDVERQLDTLIPPAMREAALELLRPTVRDA